MVYSSDQNVDKYQESLDIDNRCLLMNAFIQHGQYNENESEPTNSRVSEWGIST